MIKKHPPFRKFLSNILAAATFLPMILLSCSNQEENTEELFARAGEAFRAGNNVLASRLLIRVSEMDPENPNVWYNLGTVRLNLGLYEEAITAYQEVLDLDSTRVDALTGLTGALTGAGRYQEALHTGSLSVHWNPGDGMAFNNYGMALLETGSPGEAAAMFSTALRREPDNPSILYNCGRVSLLAGNPREALELLESACDAAPDHFGARIELARTYGVLGMHTEAEQAAVALLASHPGQTEAMEILALAYSGQGRQEEAIEVLSSILEVNPNHLRSILGLAECRYRMGDTQLALDQYRYFLSLLEDTSGTSQVRARIAQLEALHE